MRSWTAEVTAFGGRSNNRARLHPFASWVFPPIPDSCEREQLAFLDFKTERLLGLPFLFPFEETVRRN